MNRLHIALQISQCFQRMVLRAGNNVTLSNEPFIKRNLRICGFGDHQKNSSATKTNAPSSAPKKITKAPKITLIAQNDTITITSLEEAQKLAKRRDMHLLLEQELDTKTQRPVYKLVTPADMLTNELSELSPSGEQHAADDKDKNVQRKSEKTLTIGARISEHDLASRLKNIGKWLQKRHEVRILIQSSAADANSSEKIAKTIEEFIKEPEIIGKIVQKRTKGSFIKFSIVPVIAQQTDATPA